MVVFEHSERNNQTAGNRRIDAAEKHRYQAIASNQHLTAYFSPYGEQPEQVAFQWRVMMEPENSGGTYFITSLERLKDITNKSG
jgi:hypothetical protein